MMPVKYKSLDCGYLERACMEHTNFSKIEQDIFNVK